MPHSPEDKRNALLRVRRIRGQAEALERALDAGEDCGPVLQQLAAIRGAINGLMSEVLESHLREQLATVPDPDDRHAQLVQDMTTLVRTYLK
ncbi:MAG: regulator [Roseateles depolymerans]|uniref:Regulator n=1 Tax=Roseateles depolymerans TaxID=76731 RepID=A0A2W5DLM1_9BURK|nr:MAG: regulator [Roseateles depolymerans]